jgi:hemolysin activation/secretion protein
MEVSMFRVYRSRCAAGLIFLALTGSALAQVRPPDAGRVLEESKTGGAPQPPRPAPRLDVQEPVRPALTAPDSFRVLVKGFRITRATAFAEANLTPLLKDYVGRELSLADLEEAAAVITRFYRDRGYFVARAYVPAQEIREGIVEITVLEGRLGALKIFVPEGRRSETSPRLVRGILSAQQPAGSVIRSSGLERGLLLLSDTPGITARATLAPGTEPGTSDLTVDVADAPVLTGSADVDNFGNRFSGAERAGATFYLNSPGGVGDVATARVQASTGTQNLRLGYQAPVGYTGLRVGAALSYVKYKLCCEFAISDARGSASDFTATGQYPFVRSRNFNLYGTLSAAAKHFADNDSIIGKRSDKTARAFALGVSGDGRDGAGGGGLNGFSAALTNGRLNLAGVEANLSSDELTAQTNGGYSKLNYWFSRLQRLRSTTSLYVSLSGQMASKNLDSSEQFSLGGPTAVRAYPTGEAIGDQGILATLEGRWQFRENWQASVFYDRGQIRLHKNELLNQPSTTIPNAYSLSGTGLGLDYARPGNLLLRAMLAKKLGTNPGRDANDKDADGRDSSIRVWIQAIKYF